MRVEVKEKEGLNLSPILVEEHLLVLSVMTITTKVRQMIPTVRNLYIKINCFHNLANYPPQFRQYLNANYMIIP